MQIAESQIASGLAVLTALRTAEPLLAGLLSDADATIGRAAAELRSLLNRGRPPTIG
jgi:hypothetical protein